MIALRPSETNQQKENQKIPSQMEVAPPHRIVDMRQKGRLLKNTKETEKIQKG